jgi:hypothetical protein
MKMEINISQPLADRSIGFLRHLFHGGNNARGQNAKIREMLSMHSVHCTLHIAFETPPNANK